MTSTWVRVRCENCGAEPRLDPCLVTILVDLTDDRATVCFACPLCGTVGETRPLVADVQRMLFDAGCQLAVREGA